jgi:hypothetical protein
MCEPAVLAGGAGFKGQTFVGTGLTVRDHQELTITSLRRLSWLWGEHSDDRSPFIPIIQGFTIAEYARCWDMYGEAGVDLAAFPVIGLGSVCRREGTGEIADIVAMLKDLAPTAALHAFGVKSSGLSRYGHELASADSMAWSYGARRRPTACPDGRRSCSSCLHRALAWHRKIINIPLAA